MGKRLIVLLASALAVLLAATGCGSSDDASGSAEITKAQFVKQANAACEKGEEAVNADFKAYVERPENKELYNPTEEEFAELVDEVIVPNVESEIEAIRALGVPSGDEESVEAFIEAREEGLDEAKEDPKTAVQGTPAAFEKASTLAKNYGLEACGSR